MFVEFIDVLTPANHSQTLIKPFVIYSVCEYFAEAYTSIKSTNIRFIPIIIFISKLSKYANTLICMLLNV